MVNNLHKGENEMDQEYIDWNTLKYTLIHNEFKLPRFNERDIWWCSVGKNVGYEIDGKNDLVERPVLVIKKYSNDMFFGLPLSTKQKTYNSRFPTLVNGQAADIILDQGKTFSARRLNRRERVIGYKEYEAVKAALASILGLEKVTAPEGALEKVTAPEGALEKVTAPEGAVATNVDH